jgi:hypothetical protein
LRKLCTAPSVRPFDDDAVAGIHEAAGEQIESLLRAGDHQDVVRWTAKARRNRFAESPLPFGRAVLPHHHRLAGQQTIDGLLKRRGGKAVECRLAGGKRDDARIAGRAHQVADRRVVGLQRGRGYFAPPRKRRAARVGPRRHERPPPDVAAHQAFRLQLAIRVNHRRAADVERAREIALRRQPRAGGGRTVARPRSTSSTIRRYIGRTRGSVAASATPIALSSPNDDWSFFEGFLA